MSDQINRVGEVKLFARKGQEQARTVTGQLLDSGDSRSDPTAVRGETENESSMIPIHGAELHFGQAIANDCAII
jgi:hypothetical protein